MWNKLLLPLAAASGLFFVGAAHAACPFNVAGNVTADSMRDGVLLVRYARGMRGTTLVAGTGANATTVETNIANNIDKLDVNGNGVFDVDDAAIISRSVFGFASGAWLPDGRAGAYATRTTTAKLKSFVDSDCAPLVVSPPTTAQFEASRFLIQSTFGPSRADVAAFLALPGADLNARATQWINNQMAMTRPQTHFAYVTARKAEFDAAAKSFYSEMSREAFWGQALASPDQLRQRMAFALSEILVVSANGGSDDPFELAAYLDLLADNAFTNYRDILYKVALSPAMGRYLSHLRNDGSSSNPNENFAREILQLFGVGLFMLGPDGEKLLSGGQPIATYDENTVKGFAKVFTGFSYDDPYCNTIPLANCLDGYGDRHPSWNWSPDREDLGANFPPELGGWSRSMVAFPGRHSALSKQLLIYNDPSPVGQRCIDAQAIAAAAPPNAGLLPAINTTGSGVTTRTKVNVAQANDVLNKAIDNVFCHPSVGPFISKHLIRFFVTSTPSAAYVSRVTAAFNNTGGVRGDMKAVIRAVLLDAEARQAPATAPMNFGKLKEPMLRLSAIFRAFDTRSASGRYQLHYGLDEVETGISQAPLLSPTVFNYFHPEFSPPGPISASNAIGPEFEVTTTTAIASTQNYFGNLVTSNDTSNSNAFNTQLIGRFNCNTTTVSSTDPTAASRQHCLFGDMSDLYALHADSDGLFDYLNLVLMGGTLSATNKASLVTALNTAYPTTARPVLAGNPPTTTQINTYNTDVTNWQVRRRDRVRGALWLAVHLPEFQIQR
jgi:uncharacterized protein (DUF1800 family)